MSAKNEEGLREGDECEISPCDEAVTCQASAKSSSEGVVRKFSRFDSLQLEAGKVSTLRRHGAQASWAITMHLAFQSIGVVYGDIGTSPLYVFSSIFPNGLKDKKDILGALSLIFYTLTLIPFIKYALIVLWANDNGNGGAFALYSLISRYAKVRLVPNQQAEDAMLSNYKLEMPSSHVERAQWIKEKVEGSQVAKIALIFLTLLGTSMIMGDGVLTPCISVLSSVSGIQQKATSLSEGTVAVIAIVILFLLFNIQRFGIHRVGYTFAPILVVWFFIIGSTGIYNLITHDVGVLRAVNPKYIIDYFKRNGKQGWISLGGVVLCVTGAEAMFADLGHFNVRAIQISFTALLFPSVLLAYAGQAAYLTKFPEDVANVFYKSVPGAVFWPTFVVAVAASIIASQAVISCVFAIISQAQTLGCFPRVKVVHTSPKYEGQVYIPELNTALMIACILVTGSFRTTEHIGNAYGIAVICDMTITTFLVTMVMLIVWKKRIWQTTLFFIIFGGTELTYLSAVLFKFVDGGYLPIAFSFFIVQIMAIWHYVHVRRYKFELEHKIPGSYIKELATRQEIRRLPGVGLLYSELVEGIPPIFAHFIEKIPSIHSVLVFVSVKHIPISNVEMEERFLFRQVEPKEYKIYRCVVRYGYKDKIEEGREFESLLIERLQNFIEQEYYFSEKGGTNNNSNRIIGEEEKQFFQKEMEKGVVYLLGETEVVAASNSSIIKKIVVNYVYNFLRRNFRQGGDAMYIPRSRLLKVGMTYEI